MPVPAEIFAPGCIYLVIACFGAAGGAASGFLRSLETSENVPSANENGNWDARFRVNILVGIVAAFAFIPFGARILDLDFSYLVSPESLANHVKCMLFLASLSVLGGFAGHKMLSSLTNKMLQKVEDLDDRTKILEQDNEVLKRENGTLDARTKNLEQDNESLKQENKVQQLELLEARASIHIENQSLDNALQLIIDFFEILPTTIKVPPVLVAKAYMQKGRILKRLSKPREALDAVETALKNRSEVDSKWVAILLFNKACYQSVLLGRPATEREGKMIVEILIDAFSNFRFQKDLLNDSDFDNIRNTEAFMAFQGSNPNVQPSP